MGYATCGTGTHTAAAVRVGPTIGVAMLSIENIIKLHDMGFSSEQIENINGLKGLDPEPNTSHDPEPKTSHDSEPKTSHDSEPKTSHDSEPKTSHDPEPKTSHDPEPKTNPNHAIQKPDGTFDMEAIIKRLDSIEKTFKAAMVIGSEQPKEMGVDDILSVILSPSGEPLK